MEAARLARAAGRPVKVRWSREEEMAWVYVRPAAVIDIRKRELATTIDGIGDEPWGTMMTGTLNYCH